MDGWKKVPDVLLLHVYSYLSFSDKIAASSTCKHWRELLFHPANWSHINLYYALGGDRKREHFLKCKTGHFISGCSIIVPTEPQLIHEGDTSIPSYSSNDHLDSDITSLLQYLCLNKNLRALSIFQQQRHHQQPKAGNNSSTYGGEESTQGSNTYHVHDDYHSSTRPNPNCILLKKSAFSAGSQQELNNSGGGMTTNNNNFDGVLTRSKCQKMREQSLRANPISCHKYIGSKDYDVELDFMYASSEECSQDASRNQLLRKNGIGSKQQYIEYLKRIISTANNLTHLSLGYLPSLTLYNNEIVRCLTQCQSNHIKSLHLSRCQELSESVYQPIDVQDLLMLRSLQHLSLDTEDLSDQLLVSLSEGGRVQLASLSLSMFRHKEGVRLVRDRTWHLLHESCPDLQLSLNLIRCPEAIRDMMTVINASMPLTHLRVLFCDEFYVSGFHHVARHQAPTLCSLQIIESMREGPMFYDIGVDEQDPFVMMAWRCKKLSAFSVIGIALREHDVLAVARLRGMQLSRFEVLEECITAFNHGETEFEEDFSMSFENFCEEISTSIGQEWLPLTDEDVDDSIMYIDSPESGAFLPLLMKDQQYPLSRGM